jgi:AcrR family transcriptional regulator
MPRVGLNPLRLESIASRYIDRHGFEALTLAAVADEAGVRLPSLYKHVDGLPALKRRLAIRGVRGLRLALARALAPHFGPDGAAPARVQPDQSSAALASLADAYLAWARRHPGLYVALQPSPAPADRVHVEAAEQLVGVLLQLLAAYGLSGEAAWHAARGVRAALHGFVSLEHAGGFGKPLAVAESYRRLVAALDVALRSPAYDMR